MQIGVPDVADARLGRGRDHHVVISSVAARLDLIGGAQQIDIDLEAGREVPEVSWRRNPFTCRTASALFVIALDGVIEIRLRLVPEILDAGLVDKTSQARE